MAFANTSALARELESALPRRPFSVRFWDGRTVRATESPAPTFTFHSPRALAHVIRAPGELGLGRAYVDGLLEVDDLDGALRIVDTFEPPPLSVAAQARLGVAVVRACGLVLPPKPPAAELRLRGERHTISRDRRAVRHHYDVGNDFFALFLDESMTYSCAYWSGGADTLAARAGSAKLELVCKKLGLTEGERVLDVGCGWGSFAIHAAARHGVKVLGITLSPGQAESPASGVAAAGLFGPGRDPGGRTTARSRASHTTRSRASAWSSTWGRSGSTSTPSVCRRFCARRAAPESRDRQAAGLRRLRRGGVLGAVDVFPDGVPLPLSRVVRSLERTGLVTTRSRGSRPTTRERQPSGSSASSLGTTRL